MDWAYLLPAADAHALIPLLYRHIKTVCPESVPAAWWELLQDVFNPIAQRNMLMTSELLQVLSELKRAGVVGVPYKGPVLAVLAYDNLGLRQFQDLDLLVRERDLSAAQHVLPVLGYSQQRVGSRSQSAGQRRAPGQYTFFSEQKAILIELHTERTLRYFPAPLDFDELWARLETTVIGGHEIPTLPRADLFSFLSVHGTKHLWQRLGWICDIAELARRTDDRSWSQVHRAAVSYGTERMVALGLLLAHDVLDAPLPQEALDSASSDPVVRRMAGQASAQLTGNAKTRPGVLGRFLFRMRTRSGVGAGLRYAWRLATSPTEEDWGEAQHSGALASISYALGRPNRLIRKYGFGFLRPRPDAFLGGFLPTPVEVATKMLEFAHLEPNDVLYDLGCGDGRIVVQAAKRYGIRAVGVDNDPQRIAEACENARRERVERLTRFFLQDASRINLAEATVVVLYLPWAANLRLRETLRVKLRPGARIISRNSGMGDWPPDKMEVVTDNAGMSNTLFLWRAPLPDGRK